MSKTYFSTIFNQNLYPMLFAGLGLLQFSCNSSTEQAAEEQAVATELTAAPDNGSITLPDGFAAALVADSLGGARHIAVHENGDIYIKLKQAQSDSSIVALRDTTGDGKADVQEFFGSKGGGTGMAIHDNYLYFSSDTAVYRMALNNGELVPSGEPETVVGGFPEQSQHASKPITFDNSGHMYVTIGAPSNACQEQTRTPGSPGQDPCPLLEDYAGIWQFDANKLNQKPADGTRYASGIRNAVALDWNNAVDMLYALQHGRDQLNTLWPERFNVEQNAELPAEEFLQIEEGDDFGWPYCFYDPEKNQKLLNPEYGGDGEKVGRCEDAKDPIMAFPAHWAPNDLVFYAGDMFPENYKNGAFIAFHGSWNRAPQPQQGYLIAYVPLDESGKPAGDFERFADQFAGSGGTLENPSDAEFRPTGLATGPDGSLYITDDQQGRVWRVFYEAAEVAMR